MARRPPRSALTDTRLPSPTLFRSLPPQGRRRRTARKARFRVAGTQRRKRPADGGPIAVLSPVLRCRVTGFRRRSITPTTPLIEIGRAHVYTPATTAHLVCRGLLGKIKT